MVEDNNSGDLSKGDISTEQKFLSEILLKESQQKEKFRQFSFYVAWVFSSLFFISVIVFSWEIMFCPNIFLIPENINSVDKTTSTSLASATVIPQAKIELAPASKEVTPVKKDDKKNRISNVINQLLIMIGLLSAVGVTLAIAVMKFSFSNEKSTEKGDNPTPISPIASSVAECIKQVTELLKSK